MRALLSCFSSFSMKSIWKMSPLDLGKVLMVFVNRLAAVGKYHLQDCENSQLQIQMQLSEKPKNSSQFPVEFPEPPSSFKLFEIKDHCHG